MFAINTSDMDQLFKVLSLEDSDLDFEIISEQLIKAGYNLNISRAVTENEFAALIRDNRYDIILADYNLPQFDAFGALKLCNLYCPDVPFICVSGSIGEIMAIELLKMGAVDYVIKDRLERLPFAVKRALEEAKEKSKRKDAEESLKKSEERLRDILFSSADWVWEVDANGRYTYSSQRDIDLFGVESDQIIGKTPFDFMPEGEASRIKEIFLDILKKRGHIVDLENWNVGKDGQLICLLTNGVPIFDHNGEFMGYRGVDKNITERKQAEQDLIKAKERAEASDKLKTVFMNNISHEIRTPLNGILGFGQIITDPDFAEAEKEEYYRMLQESSDRLLNTITNIMDLSLITSGNQKVYRKTVKIGRLFKSVIDRFTEISKRKNLAIINPCDCHKTDFEIVTDGDLLEKIIFQLIDNAVKFTANGTIEVSCETRASGFYFYVKDTGIGISSEAQSRIFANFMQEEIENRKFEGTGIGLSIAQGLVELLGGEIGLESEKGKGSLFYFTLPKTEQN